MNNDEELDLLIHEFLTEQNKEIWQKTLVEIVDLIFKKVTKNA